MLFALILLFDADGKKDAHVDASLQARPDHPIAILSTKSRVDDAWVTIQVNVFSSILSLLVSNHPKKHIIKYSATKQLVPGLSLSRRW